jgi:hypothetical protein
MKNKVISILFFLAAFNGYSQNCSFPFSQDKITSTAYLTSPGTVYAKVQGKDIGGIFDDSDYQWEWRDSNNQIVSTTNFVQINNVSTTIYLSVTTRDYNGCQSYPALVTIPFYSPDQCNPTININVSNGVYCDNGTSPSTTLSVTNVDPSLNYSWYCNGTLLNGNNEYSTSSLYFQYNLSATTITVLNVSTGLSNFSLEARSHKPTVCGTASGSGTGIITLSHIHTSISPTGSLKISSDKTQIISTASDPSYTYQWMKDGTRIEGATQSSYTANASGVYSVVISTFGSCGLTTGSLVLTINKAPVANAGPDQTIVLPINSAVLNGTGIDTDGTIASYSWRLVSGPPVNMTGNNTPGLAIQNLSAATYVFGLTVTDDFGEKSQEDQATVTVSSPPNNYNWIKETTVMMKDRLTTNDVAALQIQNGEKNVSWRYFDGLGRPSQFISVQGSPTKNDIVQPISYDPFGRENKKYLPYVSDNTGQYKPDGLNNPVSTITDPLALYQTGKQYQFYQSTSKTANDSRPFSETIFEPSPLNRPSQDYGAGQNWKDNNKSVSHQYLNNTSGDVYLFSYDPVTGLVSSPGSYGAGLLHATITTDEQGNDVREYTDKLGRVVCKKVQYKIDGNGIKQYTSTYYLYDDFGNLVVVLPPEAVKKILSQMNQDN